jgi:DNA-binding transcriptional ArsR family regulator
MSVAERDVTGAWRRRPDEHGFPDPLLDEIAARFRLLGEPLRLKLLAALSTSERSVGDLVSLTGANQPNVSKHLAALAQGGLVSRRKAGTTIYYTLTDMRILALCDAVCATIQDRLAAQARLLGLVRPEREDAGAE